MKKTLVIIGAGPKAIAIALKAKVLTQLGYAVPNITIVEKDGIGAHWDGLHGYTTGNFPMGTSPQKDMGYPYGSVFGKKVDQAMQSFSWQSYCIDMGVYTEWVDRGKLPPTNRDYAHFLQWIAKKADIQVTGGTVRKIEMKSAYWLIQYGIDKEVKNIKTDGLLLTGPGYPKKLSWKGEHEPYAPLVTDLKNFYDYVDYFGQLHGKRIAVCGGGTSAEFIVRALLEVIDQKSVEIDLYNGHGLIFARNQNYMENRYFSDPAGWLDLDERQRMEFIHMTNPSTMSPAFKQTLDQYRCFHYKPGKVNSIRTHGDDTGLIIEVAGKNRVVFYDAIITAIGSDPMSVLHNFIPELALGDYLNVSRKITHDMSVSGIVPKLHLPMLSALSQGPGFPALSCLGLLADRVLSSYVR